MTQRKHLLDMWPGLGIAAADPQFFLVGVTCTTFSTYRLLLLIMTPSGLEAQNLLTKKNCRLRHRPHEAILLIGFTAGDGCQLQRTNPIRAPEIAPYTNSK